VTPALRAIQAQLDSKEIRALPAQLVLKALLDLRAIQAQRGARAIPVQQEQLALKAIREQPGQPAFKA
jgi:hypothetical protein